jgi:hypothetical protein
LYRDTKATMVTKMTKAPARIRINGSIKRVDLDFFYD